VQVVDERAPSRVGVEYNVGEADWAVPVLRKQGEVSAVRSVHALGPEGQPLRVKVAIKVTIRVRPPVVTPPAVRVNPYTPLSRRRYCPSGSVPMTTTPKGTRGPLVVVVTPLGTTRTTRAPAAPAPRAAPRAL